MVQIVVEFPESVFAALKKGPTEFSKEMRLAAAVKWYELRRVSQERAAEIAGLSRAAFVAALSSFGVSPFQVDAEELVKEATDA